MPDDLSHLRDEFTRMLAAQDDGVQRADAPARVRADEHACAACGHGPDVHWWSLDDAGCTHPPTGTACPRTRFIRHVQHIRLRWYHRLLSWVSRRRIPRAYTRMR